MKLIFIVNQKSGNGKGTKIWRAIQKDLSVPYDVYITQHEKQAIAFSRAIAEQSNNDKQPILLIGIGGDGTYHEILNGIQGAKYITVGAVCAGSGNDFKRAYGQFSTAASIEKFLQSPSHTFQDGGKLLSGHSTYYFVNNSGIGFDATVAITANESKMKKLFNKVGLGKLIYVYYLIKCLFTYKPFHLKLEVNGEEKTYNYVWFVTASNQPFFGGGMNLSPTSNTQDGELELTVVHHLNRYKLLFVFITVFFAKHTKFKEVVQMKSNQFVIHMNENYLMHADGEKLPIETKANPITFLAVQENWQLAQMDEK